VLVTHECNPNYSGDKDQEDHGLKPAQTNSLQDPVLEKILHKEKGWWSDGVAQGEGPEFKPQYLKK
jgi:hypothetical protein